MITISLCMIVKNEAKVLERCLNSIHKAVDEIIIVDTGSTDDTKKIARKFTKKVYDFEWINDFSAARNFSFSKATKDYQLWLDADDVVPSETVENLIKLKQELPPDTDMVTMKYITHFDEDDNPLLIATRERLSKTANNYQWIDPVHETVPIQGKVHYSELVIHHRPIHKDDRTTRNIDIYSALESSGQPLTARQQYYFARELKDHGYWAKSAYYFEKFLESGLGWGEDNIATCFNLATCYNQLHDQHKTLPVLFKSFEFDSPRAEICCEIGYHYKRQNNWQQAFKWFELATKLGEPNSMGFVLVDYWGYIPNLEACVAISNLGDHAAAQKFNEAAAKFKPTSPAVQHNRDFFKTVLP